jgi:glutamate formiminotransferase
MEPVIQCVPNFSEGRDISIVRSIADAAANADGAMVVDYSSDADHNRMVLTLLGGPDEVRRSVIAAAGRAIESIDLRRHGGVHPRIGAVDVVPFVPVQGITMPECVELSREVGRVIAGAFGVPVFFYGESALRSDRVKLADLRRGGFERLLSDGMDGDRAPDLGPRRAHLTAGATAVGARFSLVAFNVILESDDLDVAKEIAKRLRSGDAGLSDVKSIGVRLASRGQVQVSMNITRPDKVSASDAFSYVQSQAAEHGIKVAESEFIGCIAKQFIGNLTPVEMKAHAFRESQILDTWL